MEVVETSVDSALVLQAVVEASVASALVVQTVVEMVVVSVEKSAMWSSPMVLVVVLVVLRLAMGMATCPFSSVAWTEDNRDQCNGLLPTSIHTLCRASLFETMA